MKEIKENLKKLPGYLMMSMEARKKMLELMVQVHVQEMKK